MKSIKNCPIENVRVTAGYCTFRVVAPGPVHGLFADGLFSGGGGVANHVRCGDKCASVTDHKYKSV